MDYDVTKAMDPKAYREYDQRRRDATAVLVTVLCLRPRDERLIQSPTKLAEFFPSGIVFNASRPKDIPTLTSDGVGNSATLSVPIEVSGRRRVAFRLTARRS